VYVRESCAAVCAHLVCARECCAAVCAHLVYVRESCVAVCAHLVYVRVCCAAFCAHLMYVRECCAAVCAHAVYVSECCAAVCAHLVYVREHCLLTGKLITNNLVWSYVCEMKWEFVFRSEHPNVIALSPNLPSHPGPWAGAGPVTDFQVDWRKKDPPSWPNQHRRKQSSSKVFDSSYQAHTPLTGSHSALMSRIDDLVVVQMVHIG
jgi:hypothetical protein